MFRAICGGFSQASLRRRTDRNGPAGQVWYVLLDGVDLINHLLDILAHSEKKNHYFVSSQVIC